MPRIRLLLAGRGLQSCPKRFESSQGQSKRLDRVIPFALEISALPEEPPGCPTPHLTLGDGSTWMYSPST
ncbi:protein of unknown function [Methylotuvimicrobium alcaliphilum 20Z]|uniref:Uncharacterized protein n=1 Tax=Methylotuvimicrobium alcaliphilum (strain DSM 19304 / NCIMB 14124 / VKM B-2133 / 20Z) TaxID=1091494 RepID=G4T2P9_META2|nr:protein of unknown function [Methylotuvimicrobium alcaliphilum 20Z]